MDEKPKKITANALLKPKVPCLFCGERLAPHQKKTHACWLEIKNA